MSHKSFVYSNIYAYRSVLNLLYLGRYKARFRDITAHLTGNVSAVLELCFGDIYVAGYCPDHGIRWTGLDINTSFVQHACRRGFDARVIDILDAAEFPTADVCVMAGSLYHFHESLGSLLSKMLRAAPRLLISEPVVNISSGSGWIGRLARRCADPGTGKGAFRFNEATLTSALDAHASALGYSYQVLKVGRDMLLEIRHA